MPSSHQGPSHAFHTRRALRVRVGSRGRRSTISKNMALHTPCDVTWVLVAPRGGTDIATFFIAAIIWPLLGFRFVNFLVFFDLAVWLVLSEKMLRFEMAETSPICGTQSIRDHDKD
ncbi:unnamed protein product [Heligmosomoides polygyrus]|uniref:7TM_GPCR_Srx domain-containing protein n=1 Tax=Heligmosomoides polygyrus TaxID=6339 RepID=A0A183FXG6_HELPZ|nr:unnamed protein product [Heligmosomoides polygyrus]